MKRLLITSLLLLTSCATSSHQPDEVRSPASGGDDQAEAEARILRAEDRREYDRELVRASVQHSDPARRERIAVALGRIGTATFDDANGNGSRDPQETAAGVAELPDLRLAVLRQRGSRPARRNRPGRRGG